MIATASVAIMPTDAPVIAGWERPKDQAFVQFTSDDGSILGTVGPYPSPEIAKHVADGANLAFSLAALKDAQQ